MILYFSGTGNSAYVAKQLGEKTQDTVLNLFEKIRAGDSSRLHSDTPWVIVAPTYAWRIPRILQTWLAQTELAGSKEIYFVLTCGGNIGNAGKYLRALCVSKRMDYRGCASVVMPENYIAMFATPTQEQARETIRQAQSEMERAAALIQSGQAFAQPKLTTKDRLNSGLVNAVFYPAFVHAKKFYATDACIACGKCAALCPLGNIHMENGKPAWGKRCTHCMACICRCPSSAIEYGAHSKGLPRYVCPEN